jgi:ribosomal protein L2
MFLRGFNKKKKLSANVSNNYYLARKGVTSGGSRFSFFFRNKLPLSIKFKGLMFSIANKAGRNSSGSVVLWTRGATRRKKNHFNVNTRYRFRGISFIANIIMVPFTRKIISLVFNSSGSITYVPTSSNHSLFSISKLYKFSSNMYRIKNKLNLPGIRYFISQGFFLIRQLPRNKPISLLEVIPGMGSQYVRSVGVKGKMTRMEFNRNTALVILPSGVRKIFSIFSLGSIGPVPLTDGKYWKNNKAGIYRNFGRKPTVRGVAMNPIDHPNGGRTKALNYPRTP